MDVELLRDFVNIFYTKDFDWVSKSRSMDRSSASRRMALLESTVGAKLFASKGRGKDVALTPAGAKLLDGAIEMCQTYDEVRKNIAYVQREETLKQNGIKFTAFHSIATTELPKFIRILGDEWLSSELNFSASISTGSDFVPIDTLASNDTDFAVIYKPVGEDLSIPIELGKRFDWAIIGEDKLVPICHLDCLDKFQGILKNNNIKTDRRAFVERIPIINYSTSTYLFRLVDRKLSDEKLKLSQCTFTAHDATMSHILVSMVQNKLGLAWVLESTLAEMIEDTKKSIAQFTSIEDYDLTIPVDIVIVRTTDRTSLINEKIWTFAKQRNYDIMQNRKKNA